MAVPQSQSPPLTQGAPSDAALLAAFIASRDAHAFQTLTNHHAPWVYAAAFRQLQRHDLADDATQAVFILLARRAKNITPNKLSGWLFLTLNYTVRAMKRAQRRRIIHESQAAVQAGRRVVGENPREPCLADHLDEAVANLPAADRAAILLRYHQSLDFPEIATQLAITEPAARKRVTRAVERLRQLLGPNVSPQNLSAAVALGIPSSLQLFTSHIAQTALSASLSSTALSLNVAAAVTGATSLMTLAKVKIAGIIILITASVTAVTTTAIIITHPPTPNPPVAPSPPTVIALPPVPAPPDTRPFEQIYALAPGQVFRRVFPPFPPARSEYLRKNNLPEDPSGLIVSWKDNTPLCYTMNGRAARGYTPHELTNAIFNLRVFDLEGDSPLRNHLMEGDYVFDAAAPRERVLEEIAKITSEDLGFRINLVWREVPRPVIVFTGTWKHTPLPNPPPDIPQNKEDLPQLEFFAKTIDTRVAPENYVGTSGEAHLGDTIGNWISQEVIVNATGIPGRIAVHCSNTDKRDAEFKELFLQNVTKQTGLVYTVETRNVQRLFIEVPP